MKNSLLKNLLACVGLLASTPCWSCPDGYYGGPFGSCIPNSGTLTHPSPQTPPVIIPPAPPPPPPIPIPSFVPPPPQPAAILHTLAPGVQSGPGRLLIDPGSFISPSGLPAPGDFVQYVFNNPDKAVELLQHPQNQAYLPVANAIISSRDAALRNGAWSVPRNVSDFLQKWYPPELIAQVRWTTHYSALQNTLQAGLYAVMHDKDAVTLINVIVFKDADAAQDLAVWAHELVHVTQYKQWGVFTFAQKWVDDSGENGEVESPAYARQAEAQDVIDRDDDADRITVVIPDQPYR